MRRNRFSVSPMTTATALYTVQAIRRLEALTVASGLPESVLMARAGRAALEHLLAAWPQPECITVFCGSGNNGGDGFVLAQQAQARGLPVQIVLVGQHERRSAVAQQAFELAASVPVHSLDTFDFSAMPAGSVLVDALLGIGLSGRLRPEHRAAVRAINDSGLPILALDVPSGVQADSGRVQGEAVRAHLTVTFIGHKRGLWTGDAVDHSGRIALESLGLPADVYVQVPASGQLLPVETHRPLPPRSRNSHKGDFGSVLVIGGDAGMPGAPLLAAEAAARCGAGRVAVATCPEHVAAVAARCPVVMAHGVISGQELEPLLEAPTVLVAGPGLGTGPWGEQLLQKAAASGKLLVLDADALNLLAQGRLLRDVRRENWVLTPHPGEAARLLGKTTAQVQAGRFAAVAALRKRWGGAVVLKGAGTLIADGRHLAICRAGNPGMASGGMGDVLSGVIAALLAQGLPPGDAAREGVRLHALAADAAVADGERGLLATDLLTGLRRAINGLPV